MRCFSIFFTFYISIFLTLTNSTHYSLHDKLWTDAPCEIPKLFTTSVNDTGSPCPLRIHFDYDQITSCNVVGDWKSIVSDNGCYEYKCQEVDVFNTLGLNRLKYLLEGLRHKLEDIISVLPLESPLDVHPLSFLNDHSCHLPCTRQEPSSYTKNTYNDTDLVIFVHVNPIASGAKVWGVPVATDLTGRPVVGILNVNPRDLLDPLNSNDHLLYILQHEIIHILGFSHHLYPSLKRDHLSSQKNWLDKEYKFDTEMVLHAISSHFNCNVEHLHQAAGSHASDIDSSFWSPSLFGNELMTPTIQRNEPKVLSHLTFAMLSSTFWYTLNYSKADTLSYGKNASCSFIEEAMTCPSCSTSYGCTADKKWTTKCHFTDSSCGYESPLINCQAPNSRNQIRYGESFSLSSRCFPSSLFSSYAMGESFYSSRCYSMSCNDNNKTISIYLPPHQWIDCISEGQQISVDGYEGHVICPSYHEYCLTISIPQCPSECSKHGTCIDGKCYCHVGFAGEDCSFTSCPLDSLRECNGQGKCNHETQTCECSSSWEGNNCESFHQKELNLFALSSSSFEIKPHDENLWIYFVTEIYPFSSFYLSTTMSQNEYQLFGSFHSFPLLAHFDHIDEKGWSNRNKTQTINFEYKDNLKTYYYVGLFLPPFSQDQVVNIQFHLKETSDSSPCPENHYDSICSTFVSSLSSPSCTSISAKESHWTYYSIQVDSETTILLTYEEKKQMPLELYARLEDIPTKGNSETYRAIELSTNELKIRLFTPGKWLIGILASDSSSSEKDIKEINSYEGILCSIHEISDLTCECEMEWKREFYQGNCCNYIKGISFNWLLHEIHQLDVFNLNAAVTISSNVSSSTLFHVHLDPSVSYNVSCNDCLFFLSLSPLRSSHEAQQVRYEYVLIEATKEIYFISILTSIDNKKMLDINIEGINRIEKEKISQVKEKEMDKSTSKEILMILIVCVTGACCIILIFLLIKRNNQKKRNNILKKDDQNQFFPKDILISNDIMKKELDNNMDQNFVSTHVLGGDGFWHTAMDPTQGQIYYWNEKTKETRWDPPSPIH